MVNILHLQTMRHSMREALVNSKSQRQCWLRRLMAFLISDSLNEFGACNWKYKYRKRENQLMCIRVTLPTTKTRNGGRSQERHLCSTDMVYQSEYSLSGSKKAVDDNVSNLFFQQTWSSKRPSLRLFYLDICGTKISF